MSAEKHSLQRQADRARAGSKRSVLSYLVILFAAAFVLLLLSYFMQQRSNEEAIDGLKQSVSAMQSAQDVYEENIALREQVDQLEGQLEEQARLRQTQQEELAALEEEKNLLAGKISDLERSTQALDWFWQINEAYVRGRTTLARQLIQEMGDELPQYLPRESITNNERFSPYDRYQEIYDALY